MNWEFAPWILSGILAVVAMSLAAAGASKRRSKDSGDLERDVLRHIARQLEALDGIGRRLEGLDRAFRIPRVRGGFGETLLEELLGSWLPKGSWIPQYGFPDGSRADAVVRMGSRIVAIDAKFPLEQLEDWLASEEDGLPAAIRRVFLKHAGDIASKYVRPDDGTLGFALMYLPAETLHYRLVRDDDGSVMKECLRLGILPVGPAGLFAYLQTVSYGLRGLSLPEEGKELRRRIDRLRRDFAALAKPLSTASTHLKNLGKSWEEVEKRWEGARRSLEDLDAGGGKG